MIRAPLGKKEYWDKWVNYLINRISEVYEILKEPPGDPTYEPQYIYEMVIRYLKLIFYRYSRGDSISELSQYFPPLLDAWEKSERLGKNIWTEKVQYTRNAWEVNLDYYIDCFWLVGLALVLEIPDDQWKRLLALIDNDGQDELLDRIIASREPGRKIGNKICFPRPYQRLLDAINAPKEEQAKLLFAFVKNWYKELKQPRKKDLAKSDWPFREPAWYTYGDVNFEGGAYFGRWCVEAVAAVKAFGLDDSLCLGHEHYPGDLLRPNGPTTHKIREENLEKISTASKSQAQVTKAPKVKKPGFFSRVFGN